MHSLASNSTPFILQAVLEIVGFCLLGLLALVGIGWRLYHSQWVRIVSDYKRNAEAFEDRVKVLEALLKDTRDETFTVKSLYADIKSRYEEVLGQNQVLQRQINRLRRREKQLVDALEGAGIKVPKPIDDEDL